MKRLLKVGFFLLAMAALAHAQDHTQGTGDDHRPSKRHPNILFIIMDDVGIDR